MSDKHRLWSGRFALLLRRALCVRFREQPDARAIIQWIRAQTRSAPAILASLVLVLSGPRALVASEVHHHGRLSVSIVVDGKELVVLLEGPAEHFLGFEHAPRTTDEKATLRDAVDSFDETPLLAPVAAAKCERIATGDHSNSDALTGSGHHWEFELQWTWRCEEPEHVRALVVEGADRVTGVDGAEITVITNGGQGYSQVSFPQATIEFPAE